EAIPLDNPLLRFRGRTPPEGGEEAIRAAWNKAMCAPLSRGADSASSAFGYDAFGPSGAVASDRRDPALGIREIRFANGVMLNIKRTDIEKDKVLVQLSLDGGGRLDTKENPLASEMMSVFDRGGLGLHSQDDLQSILAGRTVEADVR